MNSIIHCPQNADCEILCSTGEDRAQVCRYMTVYSSPTTQVLTIRSVYQGNQIMAGMNIYCPKPNGISPNCIITATYGFYQHMVQNTKIYALQGLTDVEFTCDYSGSDSDTICYEVGVENPIIYCTENYAENCTLDQLDDSVWQCQDTASNCNGGYTLQPTLDTPGNTRYSLMIILSLNADIFYDHL